MARTRHFEDLHYTDVEEVNASGSLAGAGIRYLSRDEEDGAYTAYIKFPAGYSGGANLGNSHEFLVLKGSVRVHGQNVSEGSYAFIPRDGEDGRSIISEEGAEAILMVGSPHEGTGDPLVVDPNTIPWRSSVHDNIAESKHGRVINISKILRRDPVTPTATGLSAMFPGADQDCAEWHESADEGYMIRGDMLVVGPNGEAVEMVAGTYNWRPSNDRHLPKYSHNGNLRLFRVVGGNGWEDKLYYAEAPEWPGMRDAYRGARPFSE